MKNFCKTDANIKNILGILKGISDENRLKIICFLKNGPQCVCDIVKFLDLPQNLVSHHLKKLRDKGILNFKKEGLKIEYSINKNSISKIKDFFIFL